MIILIISLPRLFELLIISIPVAVVAQTQPQYVSELCQNTSTFVRNSTFQTNLNNLFSSLSSNAKNPLGFYNSSSGRDPDDVYGLFQCRGDVSTDVCRNCVAFATKDITARCPLEKEALIWYDECLLRYSNLSFFSSVSSLFMVEMQSKQNISDPNRLDEVLASSMNEAAAEASSAPAGAKKFAVREANFTEFQPKLYSLVQCTGDLYDLGCSQCLQAAISTLPSCCSGKQGGRVLLPACYIRYEVFPFYNASAVEPPPPPVVRPPPPGTTPQAHGKGGISTVTTAAIVAPIIASTVLFCLGFCFLRRRARKKYDAIREDREAGSEITTVESLQIELNIIEAATKKFSDDSKLGEGGFGKVYKGTLPNGQEIAVKKLSKNSRQGSEEFKNEVVLLAKLQHRNLVRLLGFCLQGEEKMLVYEFVPNKSLNYFLFDPAKQSQLDWSTRYKIIGGISRGILYLHEDSRLRIIHRDLKASNILLDGDMNPKISDFSIARIFEIDQTQETTNRIIGTFGYMPPEYAMHGRFSVKSDVYSFGVLVLEIICEKNNTTFYQANGVDDVINFVWKSWRDGKPLEVLDPCLKDSCPRNEVVKCIQIGLLCVQEDPADRPTMTKVALMLNSSSVTLQMPKQPAFYHRNRSELTMPMKGLKFDESTNKSVQSVDGKSITEEYPR